MHFFNNILNLFVNFLLIFPINKRADSSALLFRKIILKEKQYVVKNNLLILLGFRRLLYNPYAPNQERVVSTDLRVKKADLRKNY